MADRNEVVLVLGATGNQGGATARALRRDGWHVRALVRDPSSAKARALADLAVELVKGDLGDRASLERATTGAYGVFSMQPSSGQPSYGITDADELRIGKEVIDVAKGAGVQHFVYTSVAGASPTIGIGHFESKWHVADHLSKSGLRYTVLLPGGFMEILLEPYCGLPTGVLSFVVAPDQRWQIIATEDIGGFAARVFADPVRFAGVSLEIATQELTPREIAATISRAVGREVPYVRIPEEILAQSALLRNIVTALDDGRLAGRADIPAVRALLPQALGLEQWLERGGAAAVKELLP